MSYRVLKWQLFGIGEGKVASFISVINSNNKRIVAVFLVVVSLCVLHVVFIVWLIEQKLMAKERKMQSNCSVTTLQGLSAFWC